MPPFYVYALENRPINRLLLLQQSRRCLSIGIVRASDVRDCLAIEFVYTIDFGGCLLIGFVRTIVFRDYLLIGIVGAIDVRYIITIGIVRTNDFGVSLLIGIVLPFDCLVLSINWNCPDKWSRRLPIGFVLKIVFAGCRLIGIAWTIGVWRFQLTEIVQTNDLGDCPLIGIVLENVSTGCVVIGIAWTIDFGWCTWIEIVGTTVGTTAFGDRP